MFNRLLFIGFCLIAALAPITNGTVNPGGLGPPERAIEWPQYFFEQRLSPLPLSARETTFAAGFPGTIKKYQAGSDQLLVRLVSRPTRKLHPAVDCFRGAGFSVAFKPIRVDREGHRWGCFEALNGDTRLRVCERIFDPHGREYTDVSAWFWNATFNQGDGPWWAYTLVEEIGIL